jgi:hypothetical protein
MISSRARRRGVVAMVDRRIATSAIAAPAPIDARF